MAVDIEGGWGGEAKPTEETKEVVDEKSNKNDMGKRACSQKRGVSHTNFSLHFFL